MPFRLDEFRAKIQFITSAEMPSLIFQACQKTETVSNTRYVQEAVCRRLAEDLGLNVQDLLDRLPPPKGMSAALREPPKRRSAEVG